jgi:hypothetical protein
MPGYRLYPFRSFLHVLLSWQIPDQLFQENSQNWKQAVFHQFYLDS